MGVRVESEVGTWDDGSDLLEVEPLQTDWSDLGLIAYKLELVETLSLLIDFYPCVE